MVDSGSQNGFQRGPGYEISGGFRLDEGVIGWEVSSKGELQKFLQAQTRSVVEDHESDVENGAIRGIFVASGQGVLKESGSTIPVAVSVGISNKGYGVSVSR